MRSMSTAALVACLSVLAACETVPSDGGGSGPGPMLNGVDLARPVRALGTEPFWSVDISGSTLTFARPDYPTRTAPNPGPSMSGSSATYRSTLNDGLPLTVTLTAGTCSDGMSDRVYRLRARVQAGGETLNGCADATDVLSRPPGA